MEISKETFEVDAEIARAWTLPAHLYTDANTLAAEKEKIFSRTWQVVGHASQVANAGDYFTADLIGEPLLFVRGSDGTLRGFYNVCRHRAGPPAEGCGFRKLFRCGYHGWTYGLDGALISATEIEGVEGFRPEDFALKPVHTEEWFNFVFVNLDPEARPLRETLGELPQQAEKFPFAQMKLFERRTYDMKCNWKTYVDNYLEGYHLPSVHPGLNRELDYNAYVVEPYARHVRQFSPIRGAQPGDPTPRRYQETRGDLTTDYFWVFPNWMLNCYPDNVSLNIVLPVDAERSLAIFEWYLPEKDHGAPAAKASVEFSDQIQIEDVGICEVVQKNLRSRSYSRGRFSVKQEKGVHAFHRMYAEHEARLFAGKLRWGRSRRATVTKVPPSGAEYLEGKLCEVIIAFPEPGVRILPSSATQLKKSQPVPESAHATLSPQNSTAIACLLLAVVTLAFYNPVARCGFVYSDDVPYITKNLAVRAGLTWDTVRYAFTDVRGGFWHPLTWLSHALDCQLFGLNPAGHHYVSLLFHTGSAILLFLLLLEATGAAWPSLVIAALFALHPENVESVAWAAERKNVLSMFLFLAALWVYGRYAKRGGTGRYLAVVALFAAGLMAKTQIITLPCVLLLWDYWPLRRMFAASSDVPGTCAPRSFSYLVKEKLPLFVLAAVGSVITIWAQREASAFRSLGEISFSARLGNTVIAYVRYIAHTLWPVRLSPIYPHSFAAPPLVQVAGATALLVLVTALVIRWRNLRYLPVGWFLFLGTLVPVIGLVQVGEQAMADRYAYLPMIGLFVMLVWPVAEAVEKRHIPKAWVAVPTVLVLGVLGGLTYRQLGYWHDGETLWRYALSVTDRNYLAHDNLAMVMDGEGRVDEAINEFRASEALHDYPPEQILKIGLYEQRYGHFQGAIEQYQKVSQSFTNPKQRAAVLAQIGSAYVQMQNYDQARQSYESALQVNPNDATALTGAALLAERAGDFNRAVGQLDHAVKVAPSDVGLLLLADALRHAGRLQEAQSTEEIAQKVSPDLNEARKTAAQTQLFFGYKAS